jgi:hypothetical protein
MNTSISGKSAVTQDVDNKLDYSNSQQFSTYCLKVLGINNNTELRENIFYEVDRLPGSVFKNEHWLEIMRIIAEICANKDGYIFTQSQLYDFLILATKQIGEKESKRYRLSELVFKVYKDIMENYIRFDDSLRSQYPLIIIDLVSILLNGKDTIGREISPHALEKYLEERKARSRLRIEDPSNRNVRVDRNLIDSLSKITGREEAILVPLVSRLDSTDIDKLTDLCVNYEKLQKYTGLMDLEGEFRKELENELGRKLTYNQFQHASVSVRKTRSYIENVLDGKFLPHGSHGINHVRHNLEYGYQVIGIIERKRRASPRAV